MITVNCMNISNIDEEAYRLFGNSVSAERRIKAARYYHLDDSKRCICAEILLKYSLFQAGVILKNLEIIYNEYGKPYLNNTKGFLYNLSHAGQWVVIAYGRTEIGVDIEKIQSGKGIIKSNYFTADEIDFIHAANENEYGKRFTQLWTLKESYLKYLGLGFSADLESFSINALDGVVINKEGIIQSGIKLMSYLFDTDYYISVCAMEKEVCIREITLDELRKLLV
jgi:4'-phosphopantetheinyl transferase